MSKPKIDFLLARNIAIDRARQVMEGFFPDPTVSNFEEVHLECDTYWLFFRNRDIAVPAQTKRIFANGAFAVSKTGQSLIVHDYFGDTAKLSEQVERLSEYFSPTSS